MSAVQERIFGTETGYGLMSLRGEVRAAPVDGLARAVMAPHMSATNDAAQWHRNGSRLYLDLGAHPEHASPECASALSAVLYDKAGDLLIDRLACAGEAGLRAQVGDDTATLHVLKNNLDSSGSTFGCHENYLTPRDVPYEEIVARLAPHLLTRQIFTGSGALLPTRDGARYVLSSRAQHIELLSSQLATRQRPLVTTRDEPHAPAATYRRLHLICGDANLSEVAAFLKLATTHLVLRCIEARPGRWRDLLPDQVGPAMRSVSADLSGRGRYRLSNGRLVRALDVQQYLWAKCRRHLDQEGASDEEGLALRLWAEALDAIEHSPDRMTRTIDWAAKLRLIMLARQRHGSEMSDLRLTRLDFAYHDVRSERSLYRRLVERGDMDRLLTDGAIADATTAAPPTRARLRSMVIEAARAQNLPIYAAWDRVILGTSKFDVPLQDPFEAQSDRVDEVVAMIEGRAIR